MSSLTTEPPYIGTFDARELGLRFAVQRRRFGWLLTLAGLALVFAGFAGFDHYGSRNSSLQKNGVHTTATVMSTALYGGRYGPNRFTEHIDVSFTTPQGAVDGVRIPIGEQDRFSVGQQVQISYDRANPHRAVFVHGDTDIGPIGFVLFFGIVFGVIVLVFAVQALRLAGGARRALESNGRTMKAVTSVVPKFTYAGLGTKTRYRTALFLEGPEGERFALSTAGRTWPSLSEPVEATVFGGTTPRSVAVVVDPQRGITTAGRIWKSGMA